MHARRATFRVEKFYIPYRHILIVIVNVDDRWIPASTWYTAIIHNSLIPDTHIIHISGQHESMWKRFRFCRRRNLFTPIVDASSLRCHMAGGLVVALECYYCCSVSSNSAVARFWIYLQNRKMAQLLRAPSVGKHNSTRVDEGRSWNILAIKIQGTNRSV